MCTLSFLGFKAPIKSKRVIMILFRFDFFNKHISNLTGYINKVDMQLITLQLFKPMIYTATQTILP